MFGKKAEITSNTIDIAKTIVDRCLKRGYKIYPSKLEKMMVIAYGEYLVKTRKKLFDSKITISESGPIISEVHENFSDYHEFLEPFNLDQLFLSEEMLVIREVLDYCGEQNVFKINKDPRMVELNKYKRIDKTISDKDIFSVFTKIEKSKIETGILCSASEKAKWIINSCLNHGYSMTTYKLEKLLILAYGEYLVKTGKKLFNENIVIWECGPMIKEVNSDFLTYAMGFHSLFVEYYPMLDAEHKLINSIVFKYGNIDAFELNDNIILKELVQYKNGDGFVCDEDIKKVFGKYMLV